MKQGYTYINKLLKTFATKTISFYRKILAKPFGFKLSSTVFTSDSSNRNADKAGFQSELEFTYDEIKEIFPEIELGDIKAKKISMKTLLFDP